jgi:alcohol dehydrogenase/L-iditol 2-dehydrogenase
MTETMQALVNYENAAHAVELRELPVPEIGDDDVLLAVQAVGVCGSDVHQYLAHQSWAVLYPVVLGHEFGGVVAKTGRNVRGFAEGDRVVSETAAVINPASPFSRAGRYNLDPDRMGFGTRVDGAMAQYVKVPERCLHRVPDGLAFEHAALTEPCCVAYNAVCVNARIRPGDTVVVIGPGPIGLLSGVMAKLSGAEPLVMVGLPADEPRLRLSRELGATDTIAGSGEEVVEAMARIGDGYGAHVVIDAAGVSASLQIALELVRPAGQIVKVGWGPQPLGFSLDPLVAKNVTLQGSFSHTWATWEAVLALLASETIDIAKILGRVAPLGDWQGCFDGMHSGEIVKAVLTPNDP